MPADVDPDRRAALSTLLRGLGARFAFLHGSRVTGGARPDSDLDVAAWFGRPVDVAAMVSHMPAGVDLVVLDQAPPWLAGRVALLGERLFDDDPSARVAWQAETRRIHLDEQFRRDRFRREVVAAHRRRTAAADHDG